ncbi:MAG: hypothetical protein NT099_00940 [Candidatus Saganbacteria bacterium]|nr:hypothetical protein [Candidatus Saganbacteria bacterium]
MTLVDRILGRKPAAPKPVFDPGRRAFFAVVGRAALGVGLAMGGGTLATVLQGCGESGGIYMKAGTSNLSDNTIQESVAMSEIPVGEGRLLLTVLQPTAQVKGFAAVVEETGKPVFEDYRDVKKRIGLSDTGGFGYVGLSSRLFSGAPFDGSPEQIWSSVKKDGQTIYGVKDPRDSLGGYLWVDPETNQYRKEDGTLTKEVADAKVWVQNIFAGDTPWEQSMMFALVEKGADGKFRFFKGDDGKMEYVDGNDELFAPVVGQPTVSDKQVQMRVVEFSVQVGDKTIVFVPNGGGRSDQYGSKNVEVRDLIVDPISGQITLDLTNLVDLSLTFSAQLTAFYAPDAVIEGGATSNEVYGFTSEWKLVTGGSQ